VGVDRGGDAVGGEGVGALEFCKEIV
jgi:hypothetical protein